jgi:hypothetical protein
MRGQNRLTMAKRREAWSNAHSVENTIREARNLIEVDDFSAALPLLNEVLRKAADSKAANEEAVKVLKEPDSQTGDG